MLKDKVLVGGSSSKSHSQQRGEEQMPPYMNILAPANFFQNEYVYLTIHVAEIENWTNLVAAYLAVAKKAFLCGKILCLSVKKYSGMQKRKKATVIFICKNVIFAANP